MKAVVENIFRKAQNEKQYCIFYGELCENLIRTELNIKGESLKVSNLKQSDLRSLLLNYCRTSFEDFFKIDK